MRPMRMMFRRWLLIGILSCVGCISGCATTNEATGIQPTTNTTGSDSAARNRARIHAELAAGYFELGNLGVALEEVNIAMQADPSYATAYAVGGLVFAALKEDQRAEEYFGRALQLNPADPDINNNYGRYLCQRGREKEGIQYLLTAVKNPLYATPERSYVNAGYCAQRTGNNAAAKDYFQRAITARPNQPQALYQLADIAYTEHDFAAAQAYLRSYAQIAPATAEVLWLALRVERKLGNSLGEKSYAQQLRNSFPQAKETAALRAGRFE